MACNVNGGRGGTRGGKGKGKRAISPIDPPFSPGPFAKGAKIKAYDPYEPGTVMARNFVRYVTNAANVENEKDISILTKFEGKLDIQASVDENREMEVQQKLERPA